MFTAYYQFFYLTKHTSVFLPRRRLLVGQPVWCRSHTEMCLDGFVGWMALTFGLDIHDLMIAICGAHQCLTDRRGGQGTVGKRRDKKASFLLNWQVLTCWCRSTHSGDHQNATDVWDYIENNVFCVTRCRCVCPEAQRWAGTEKMTFLPSV